MAPAPPRSPAIIAGALAVSALAPLQACGPLAQPPAGRAARLASPSCPHVPPPQPGARPHPPVSAFPQTLQPGHWEWDAGFYVWTPPHWQARIGHQTPAWLDGYWEANGGACVWHNGRYLSGKPAR
jgi:hypothetical protein